MSKFQPLIDFSLNGVCKFLRRLVPQLEQELNRIEKRISEEAPGMEKILTAIQESPEVKDALYRYIKEREAKE